jgi:hypothetical protein
MLLAFRVAQRLVEERVAKGRSSVWDLVATAERYGLASSTVSDYVQKIEGRLEGQMSSSPELSSQMADWRAAHAPFAACPCRLSFSV